MTPIRIIRREGEPTRTEQRAGDLYMVTEGEREYVLVRAFKIVASCQAAAAVEAQAILKPQPGDKLYLHLP